MKTLILVMSAQRMPWGPMIATSMETWDLAAHPNTRTMYYIGRSITDRFWATNTYIVSPFDEELHNLGRRTIHAYEHALTIPGWTHVARVNSSCYVHKRLLGEYIDTLPETGVLCGVEADSNVGFRYLWGGGQYILSRDVVETIIANKHRWNHEMMEDVAVSRLALDLGIKWDGNLVACSINKNRDGYLCVGYGNDASTFLFDTFEEFAARNTQHFIRVKNDADRAVDREVMLELKRCLKA